MQCPACNHEADPASYGQPAKCPECGVFYEKALALKQRLGAVEEKVSEAPPPKASKFGGFVDGWNGAKVSVEEGRRRREAESQQLKASRSASAQQSVVVVDVEMPFGSMVTFLVKLTLAAIPAAIIVAILVWGFVAILSLPGLLI